LAPKIERALPIQRQRMRRDHGTLAQRAEHALQ
jgi:hypothetical protein